MRVAILYDAGSGQWTPADVRGVRKAVTDVARVFLELGHEVRRVPARHDTRWLAACPEAGLVFNLCEGVQSESKWEESVAAILELAGIPFTGCGAWTIAVCRRKAVTNAVLQAAGLPVPRWTVADGAMAEDFPLPAIVKPACEDASVGIDAGSVVADRKALRSRLAALTEAFDEVLVQAYVPGRELNVGFVANRALPIAEIDYAGMPQGAWPILTYRAKWDRGSPEDLGSVPVCPAHLSRRLAERVVAVAEAAWRAVQGKGYGRVELRLDPDGQPWILDVNPNPDLEDSAGLSRMAQAVGWSYAELVRRVAEAALAEHRGKRLAARVLKGEAGPRTRERQA